MSLIDELKRVAASPILTLTADGGGVVGGPFKLEFARPVLVDRGLLTDALAALEAETVADDRRDLEAKAKEAKAGDYLRVPVAQINGLLSSLDYLENRDGWVDD